MFIIVVGIVKGWLDFAEENKLGYLLVFIIVPIIQFLLSPMYTLCKVFKYLSPMLLVYMPNKKKYDIHNGTSFDYLMVMRNTKPGVHWRKKMLKFYLEGLLHIIDDIEKEVLSKKIVIKGSSYFFSDRTARRMGFELSNTGLFERVNLILNMLDIIWMYSMTRGKFTIPNLLKMKTAKITGEKLVANKVKLKNLQAYLTS